MKIFLRLRFCNEFGQLLHWLFGEVWVCGSDGCGCCVVGGARVPGPPERVEDPAGKWGVAVYGGAARARHLGQVDLPVLPVRRRLQRRERTAGECRTARPTNLLFMKRS